MPPAAEDGKDTKTTMRQFIFLIGLVFLPLFNEAKESPFRELTTLTTREYFVQLQSISGKELCHQPDSYLRRCFEISESDCLKRLKSEWNSCTQPLAKKLKTVNTISQGPSIAEKVGQCLGDAYFRKNKTKFKKDASCIHRKGIL